MCWDLRARPSPVLIPQTRRPLPPRRGAPPGGRPGPRRVAAACSPRCAPPDWSAPGAQAAPASSSLPLAAAAAAAGTVSPVGTSGVNSSPAGPQLGDLGRRLSSVGDRRRAEVLWERRGETAGEGTSFSALLAACLLFCSGTRRLSPYLPRPLGVLEFRKTILPNPFLRTQGYLQRIIGADSCKT